MELRPNENIIIGKWIYHNGEVISDDNCQRIEWLTQSYLKKISTSDGGWTTTYQDVNDGRYWQLSYPHGELQGGGPPMLECLTPAMLAYQKIKNILHAYLNNIGYEIINEQHHDEVFGSRYIVWSNHQKGVRLIWDGKDSWFVLQVSTALPILNTTSWVEIQCNPYDISESSPESIDKVSEEMLDAIVNYKWGKLH
ncbi:MAG: hypothetical protein JWQ79_2178 [Mucilaginibacter sp.]|nr:hypothetical protein [Mucilaginibacter sp.]